MATGTPWDPNSIVTAAARLTGPVLHGARSTALTYEAFYGLKEKPFSLSSDSRFFYQSRAHAPAFEDLLAGIRRRESLCALTGDIGTGKTTLCRAVLQNLDRKTFSAFVPDPFASREDLLKVLLMDFGVLSVDDLTSGRLKGASRTELSYLLYEFLDTLAPLQAFAVVIIDEAQNLSVPLLEEIRILSDSDGRERQLQVVLVGQLELRQKLKLPEMRQVDQRLSVHCNLEPLGQRRRGRLHYAPAANRWRQSRSRQVLSGGRRGRVSRVGRRTAAHQPCLRSRALPGLLETRRRRLTWRSSRPLSPRRIGGTPAVAPAAVVMPPPVAAPPLQAFPTLPDRDPVNHWLAEGEKALDLAPALPAPPSLPLRLPLLVPAIDFGKAAESMAPAAADDRKHVPPVRPEFVPRTHMQRATSRLGRRLGVAALWFLALAGVGVGAASVWTLSTELAAPIVLPALPPERPLTMAPVLEVPKPPDAFLPDVPVAGAVATGAQAPR